MTVTEHKLELAKDKIGTIAHAHRAAYVNGMALRGLNEEREARFTNDLSQHGAPDVLHIINSSPNAFHLTKSPAFIEYLGIKAALELSESSPAFIEAHALIDPLVKEVRDLEVAVSNERDAANSAAAALREAEEAARQAAEKKLANDPAVIAARKALEAATPALVPAPSYEQEDGLRSVVPSADRNLVLVPA